MKELSIRERIELFWAGERPDRIPYTIYQNEWRHTASDPAWQAMYAQGLGVTWHLPSVREIHTDVEYLVETSDVQGKKFDRRILRTPVGETNSPRLVSSLATRTWPNAGFSKAISTTAFSTCSSTRFLGQGLRRLISRNASSPPFSYNSLKR